MIVKRDWTNDVSAFHCAQAMDEMGIRIIAITVHVYKHADHTTWSVWGQADNIDYKELDRRTDSIFDGGRGEDDREP